MSWRRSEVERWVRLVSPLAVAFVLAFAFLLCDIGCYGGHLVVHVSNKDVEVCEMVLHGLDTLVKLPFDGILDQLVANHCSLAVSVLLHVQ